MHATASAATATAKPGARFSVVILVTPRDYRRSEPRWLKCDAASSAACAVPNITDSQHEDYANCITSFQLKLLIRSERSFVALRLPPGGNPKSARRFVPRFVSARPRGPVPGVLPGMGGG